MSVGGARIAKTSPHCSNDVQVRRDSTCLDWTGAKLVLLACHGAGGNQEWTFANSSLVHRS